MIIELTDLQKNELKASQAKMERELPQLIAHVELAAKLRWASYKAHIDQGFSKEEALVLCQKLTM